MDQNRSQINESASENSSPFSWSRNRLLSLQKKLLHWYSRSARDLPWRQTRDPYAIWVSEIMLQQTRVAAVIPFYLRFMERFPDMESLATTRVDDVLPFWSGLGYYRRIRDLHRAAQIVVRQHGGQIPRTRDGLLSLPGIGAYTAGAILSIAFDLPEPVMDGNVARVLCRFFLIEENWKSKATGKKLWKMAAFLLPSAHSASFNQAIMELGAVCCLPQSPKCSLCPWKSGCLAQKAGRQAALPVSGPPAEKVRQFLNIFIFYHRGRILLGKKEEGALVSGLWELPSLTAKQAARDSPSSFHRRLKQAYGMSAGQVQRAGKTRHCILQREIQADVFVARLTERPASLHSLFQEHAWIRTEEVSRYGVSSLSLKSLALGQKSRLL